ncbi:MAG: NAD-dependent epimerase/dehydratase family protein [Oscillospiraceae bacterium]|nr:NAD-dependent epimerase/dehydratase family protein [Oscillospiraceae bacterium]
MKNILIIGKNSYLAKCFARRLTQCGSYHFDMISARDEGWQKTDYSVYDSVVIFSGIVHRKEKKADSELYYSVNSELASAICEKAKIGGAKQLVFMSTMSVYGTSSGIITSDTPENPDSLYGKSKLSGEKRVSAQGCDGFSVAIVRPPMVYGNGCSGNYARLSALVKKLPFFPQIENKRSMIYEENLSEFLRLLCESQKGGTYFPQNAEFVCTSKMAQRICLESDKKFRDTKIFNPLICLLAKYAATFEKLFGTLCYEKSMSQTDFGDYNIVGFEESIRICERG